jgi:hypothetical protein
MFVIGDQQLHVGCEPQEVDWYSSKSKVLSFKEMNLSIHMGRNFCTKGPGTKSRAL